MIGLQRIEVEGRRFVLVEEGEYERLCRQAAEATTGDAEDLPALPQPDARGRVPAVAYARIALARDLIRARRSARLTQEQLAERAGLRQETISRLETGKYTARPSTVDKIMQAIEGARRRNRTR